MNQDQLERLDGIAGELKGSRGRGSFGVLSTGEKLYVALAANRPDLLKDAGYSIPEALARLGSTDIASLVQRWQYRG
jgi:hypothetical protein